MHAAPRALAFMLCPPVPSRHEPQHRLARGARTCGFSEGQRGLSAPLPAAAVARRTLCAALRKDNDSGVGQNDRPLGRNFPNRAQHPYRRARSNPDFGGERHNDESDAARGGNDRPVPPRRLPRRDTYRAPNWPWARAHAQQHSSRLVRWLRMSLQGVAGSPVFAAVAEIGHRVLDVFSEAIERSLYPDVETELVVEYGITKPSPGDRTYVDPLRDWELSRVTYYHDSFGRRVYPQLQTEGTRARVFAVEYYDLIDEEELEPETRRSGAHRMAHDISLRDGASTHERRSTGPETPVHKQHHQRHQPRATESDATTNVSSGNSHEERQDPHSEQANPPPR